MDRNVREYLTEMVGTFAVVFLSAGAVIANALAAQSSGGSPLGTAGIALAYGLSLAAALAFTLPLSGGFLNPAITLMLWVFKRLDGTRTIGFIAMQLLGAAVAGGLLRAIFAGNLIALEQAHMGTPHLNREGFFIVRLDSSGLGGIFSGIIIEAAITFLLTVVIFGTILDPRAPKVLSEVMRWLNPLWVGVVTVALVLAAYNVTGAAANPARWFGTVWWEFTVPALKTQRPLWDHMIYWIGPIIGALLGGGLYLSLIIPGEAEKAHHHATHEPATPGRNPTGAGSTLFRSKK